MPTVLIVDDQPDNLYVLERLLRRQGYEVQQASSGEAALESIQGAPPDLVLLDVMMPGLDGFEVVQRLRQAPATRTLPVVLLTANAPDQRLKIQGLKLGADEYLTQPINNNELLARVQSLLRTKQSQDELRDVNTQLQALLEETRLARLQLERAQKEKDEFISIISHELKNPLASIKGYASLLQRRARKDPALVFTLKGLDVIEQQVERMNNLLDQLRDVSHIGINRFTVEPQTQDIAMLLERIAAEQQATTTAQELVLTVEGLPLLVSVDEFRISQVLGNLIGNAIKYSGENTTIAITANRSFTDVPVTLEGDRWAAITITDHGIGIAAEDQQRLFDPFFRAPNAKTKASGMGLGLFISREIVQRHGGHLWLRSAPEQGSTFGVVLPLVDA